MANWTGLANEDIAPYGTVDSLDKSIEYNNSTILTNARYYNKKDVSSIKEAIINYGSVIMSYNHSSKCLNQNYYSYYDNNSGYYSDVEGHSVCIVGWDDNYNKNNFNYAPTNNGAWLVKNSWGSYGGNKGYFWISYEDYASDGFISAQFVDSDTYDFIYQYDGSASF